MTDIIIYGYDVFKDTTRYSRRFGSAAAGESNAHYYYIEYLNKYPYLKNSGGHGEGDVQNKPTTEAENRYDDLKKKRK